MWAFEGRYPPRPAPLAAGTPLGLLGVLAGGLVVVVATARVGGLAGRPAAVLGMGVVHAALLATVLGWAGGARRDRREAWTTALLVVSAAGAAAWSPPGALGYLAVGLWLGLLAARGSLTAVGLRGARLPAVASGAAAGALLGAHLLVTATFSAAWSVRDDGIAGWTLAFAYDLGAQVPATELFFSGALFARLERRWRYLPAATAATALRVLRYLADPLLPRTAEVLVGVVLYVSWLGVLGAWFVHRTGSVWPGLAASTAFFAAYRLLAPP